MRVYTRLVNECCGTVPPDFNYNQTWSPRPAETYSVKEITDYLASQGVERFAYPKGVAA